MAIPTLKICFIGHSNVGKSSILLRFTNDHFLPPEDASATIGVDFKVKMIQRDGKRFKLTLWDTAGQERFRTLTSSYYRDAHGVILVYDVTKRETFNQLNSEFRELGNHTEKETIKIVLGNKIDKEDERVITQEEGEAMAGLRGAMFMECSAKSGVGVAEALDTLIEKIIATPDLWENQATSPRVSVSHPIGARTSVISNNRMSMLMSGNQMSGFGGGGGQGGGTPNGNAEAEASGSNAWAQQHYRRQLEIELERERNKGCQC